MHSVVKLTKVQAKMTRRMAIANGTYVSFCNQPYAAFTPAQQVAGNKLRAT